MLLARRCPRRDPRHAHPTRRRTRRVPSAEGGLSAVASSKGVAAFPTKPIRFILPFGAGGVADVTSRLVAEKLGDKLGQRFVVENMPGASSLKSVQYLDNGAPTDGTVNPGDATLADSNVADYVWTPDAAGDYEVEWHLVHSTDIDVYVREIELRVDERIAT